MKSENRNNIKNMAGWRLLLLAALLVFPGPATAQQKQVISANQYWLGYMTSARLSEHYSFWNDIHFVDEAFLVARTGITRHLPNRIDLTAGYAHGWLGVQLGEEIGLKRQELRPWAQLLVPMALPSHFSLSHRLRWDMRYRQKVQAGQIQEGYNFNHRVRWQIVFRRNLPELQIGKVIPYVTAANEVLVNFGKEVVSNTLDQNRLSLMAGGRYRNLQVQAGYMNRYVPSPAVAGRFTKNHTVVLWVFHTFDLRKKNQAPENMPEN